MDNTPEHTAAVVKYWFTLQAIQRFKNTPYLPELAHTDFFQLLKVKKELAGLSFNQDTLNNAWEEVSKGIAAAELTTTFWQWYERCKKCVSINNTYGKKTKKELAFYL